MSDGPGSTPAPDSPLLVWVGPGLTPGLVRYVAGKYGDEDRVDEAPDGVELTEVLLGDALEMGATDIHLDPRRVGVVVRMRIDGVLRDALVLAEDLALTLRNQLKTLADLNPMPAQMPHGGYFSMVVKEAPLGVRVTVAPVVGGDKMSLRLLIQPDPAQTLSDLGMGPEGVERVKRCQRTRAGIIAVAGPTGAGKTTTLYALVRGVDPATNNLVTIEDPVEAELEGVNQMQVDAGRGVTFPTGLKAMLRLDPDYLVVGEIREPESAKLAVDAVVSGRHLLCTLHARDAVGAVTSLRNLGVGAREVATNLQLVIAQRLFRRLCPECSEEGPPTAEERDWLELVGADIPEQLPHAKGCEACHQSGYRGRRGIFEIWELGGEDVRLILDGAGEHRLRERLRGRGGHRFLLEEGLDQVRAGNTTVEEVAGLGGFEPGGNR